MVMSAMVQIFSTGEAKLDITFHLSPHENICTIARMKNIQYLFYIASKIFVVI